MVAKYGFVREEEYPFIDKAIDLCYAEFKEIKFLEIGVFHGGTVAGIARRCKEIGCPLTASGVDCMAAYKPDRNLFPEIPADYTFHEGDSMDMWRKIKDTFNFLWVDGCHCVNHAMCDFLNYSPFVVVGGYALFHDTATPFQVDGEYKPEQEAWPQDHSYAGKEPSRLGVREGLKKMGLLQGHRTDWKLIEEISSSTGLMGMILLQKIKEL